jgi:RimJ/RimL family protein N-acetyltransferase
LDFRAERKPLYYLEMSEIQTPRLKLRKFVTEDAESLYRIFSDPAVIRFIGTGEPATRQETHLALESIIRHWQLHGFGRWAITDLETGKLVGCGGLRSLFGTPELVYLFAQGSWGRGLATEVATAILTYGFRQKHFPRVVAITKPGNLASIRVMQKLGMDFEKEAQYYGFDVVQYAIERDRFNTTVPHAFRPLPE